MPCSDGDAYARIIYKEDTDKINNLTAHLCELCTLVEGKVELPEAVKAWWERHQAADKRRIEAQRQQLELTKANLRRTIEQAQRELERLG